MAKIVNKRDKGAQEMPKFPCPKIHRQNLTLNRSKVKIVLSLIIIFGFIPLINACGTRRFPLKTKLSIPAHHIEVGMVLMEKGKLDDAEREFKMALEERPTAVKAYVGLALVSAKKGDKKMAWQYLKMAQDLIRDDEDKLSVFVGKIRLSDLLYSSEVFSTAKDAFNEVMVIRPGYAPACFYMAKVYEHAFMFKEAESLLNGVLKSKNSLILQAYNELDKLEKIQKAQPITLLGKEIGLKDRVTRAEMAALLTHELKLSQILEVIQAPRIILKDIGNQRFKEEIRSIVPLKIKGLSATADGYFDPDRIITRACFCQIAQSVLLKLTDIQFDFKKLRSPYKDLKAKQPYYNACMLCLIKGIITSRGKDKFEPLMPISGADILLGLKRLREEARLR